MVAHAFSLARKRQMNTLWVPGQPELVLKINEQMLRLMIYLHRIAYIITLYKLLQIKNEIFIVTIEKENISHQKKNLNPAD